MLHSLVVGLGRAGSALHPHALSTARATASHLFDHGPVIGHDPARTPTSRPDLLLASDLDQARQWAPPERTVVHICTPPEGRPAVIERMVALGYRKLIIEKPVASTIDDYLRIDELRQIHSLRVAVVAHWLDSALTQRLHALIDHRALGALRHIGFTQHKPRFRRSLTTRGHPSAFDVEIPHSLGVVLGLAGPAELVDAEWTDLHCCEATLPHMGSARLRLHHHGGTISDLHSNLGSPMRERSVALEFADGHATGHYPISEDDDHAQLRVGDQPPQVFRDDALSIFMIRAYQHFHQPPRPGRGAFGLHGEVIRLLTEAKEHCRRTEDLPTAATPA